MALAYTPKLLAYHLSHDRCDVDDDEIHIILCMYASFSGAIAMNFSIFIAITMYTIKISNGGKRWSEEQ